MRFLTSVSLSELTMESIAFAPGHISGFFLPVYHEDIYKTGSIGAGINVDAGVISNVKLTKATSQKVDIFFNGKKSSSSVIQLAVQQLIKDEKMQLKINVDIQLPVSQGFGMSAASALSTSYAIADLLNLPLTEAVKAAHFAEVTLRTGLGDVLASSIGGIEIRSKAGIPPWGVIDHIHDSGEIIICVVDSILSTKEILDNDKIQKNIQSLGKNCMDELLVDPTLKTLFKVSEWFTRNSQLASTKVIEAIDAVKPYGMASMCMLGNSVYAMGDSKKISHVLSDFGSVQVCNIDDKGARIL